MSFLFGPKGKHIFTSGNISFDSKDGVTTKSGNIFFGPHGDTATVSGNQLFIDAGAVTHSGNTWFCGNKTYTKSGSMIFGPGGSWSGVETDDDVIRIIMEDNGL